ncbi:MAG: ATP-binding protein [Polyangiaceae bacterium]|nr:ATP-binding protein [Polyangiaceae bacterium]
MSLEPINLLVGPAGAGKSNVFRALVLLQNSIHRELAELFPPGLGEFHWVRSRWAGQTDPIAFEVDLHEIEEFPGVVFRYHLSIADSPAGLYVLAETLQRKSGEEDWQWVFQRQSQTRPMHMGEFGEVSAYEPSILQKSRRGKVAAPAAPNVRMARAVGRALSSIGYYHLEVSELKSLGTGQETDRIDYYGGRLPDFLACLKSTPEHASAYEAIHGGLLELLPDVDSILVTQVGPDRQGLALSFKGHRGYITARDLSDGTVLTLGLLAILHGPKRPALLCIEEPETGLHPRRLRWLFDRLIGLAYPEDGTPRTQVILTTHSPDLMSLFNDMPEAVKVVDQITGPSGSRMSRVTPLPEILAKLHGKGQKIESLGHAWATGLYEHL